MPLRFLLLLAACRVPVPLDTTPTLPPIPAPSLPTPPPPPPTPWDPPDPGPTALVQGTNTQDELVRAIDAATDRIRVAEFLVYSGTRVDQVLRALEIAANRGVRVQVLMDEEGEDTAWVLSDLAADGVETRLDTPSRMLHNKLLIADDVVIVGSHNFTDAAMRNPHEASVRVVDAEIAAWYAQWFDAVWEDSLADPELAPLERTDLLPIADRAILPALLDCMDSAEHHVDLVMYAITWNDNYPGGEVDQVLLAAEAAAARGVQVRFVLDSSSWIRDNGINDEARARLAETPVQVWIAPPAITTHAKVLRCDEQVIIGDTNWTYSGLALVHGTSLSARDPSIVDATIAWMETVREASTPP